MSECGSLLVACLAAPLVLVVLLVAGVGYLAMQGARLAGATLIAGVELAGQALAAGVRLASGAVLTAGSAIQQGIEWGKELYDSANVSERLKTVARATYDSASSSLAARMPIQGAAERSLSNTTSGPIATAPTSAVDVHGAVAPLARAQASLVALESEPPLLLIAERWSAEQLGRAREAIQQSEACLVRGDSSKASILAGEAEVLLASSLGDAHDRLKSAERATIAAQAGNSLLDLGYEVKVAQVRETVALVGRCGHQTLALVVGKGGHLQMDMAGFEGESCDRAVKALLAQLRRNGLQVLAERIERHGCSEGGASIRKAARQGKPLEQALAECVASITTHEAVHRGVRLTPRPEQQAQRGRALLWAAANSTAQGERR